MQDVTKLSDAELAAYLRNVTLALTEIARARGIWIRITASEKQDGCSMASFGDYTYTHFNWNGSEEFEHTPSSGNWSCAPIAPNQINLSGEPHERA